MADPFTAGTMAAVSIGTSLIGGGITAAGQAQAGASNAAQYKYRAGVAELNAKIARQNSDYAIEAGGTQAERAGLTTGFTIARQKVAQSGNGFDVNSGSAAAVRDSTRDIGIVDQNTIRTNAGRKALSFRNQAIGLDAEAQGSLMAGENAKTAARYAVAGTLIGTASSVASKWAQGSQVFGGGSSGVTTYGPDQQPTGWFS